MIKTEFLDLYEELGALNEDYVLEALGYKVGDLVEFESYGDKVDTSKPFRGVVLHCFDNQSVTKLIGIMRLDNNFPGSISDTPINEIFRKISEKELSAEEKANYDKYGKPAVGKQLKELGVDDTAKKEKSEEGSVDNTPEPKNAKLNRARQNNLKIIKAFKEVGLPADDLTITAKNKKGKDYRKASDKLNKLRKTLFGEALDDENVFNQDF